MPLPTAAAAPVLLAREHMMHLPPSAATPALLARGCVMRAAAAAVTAALLLGVLLQHFPTSARERPLAPCVKTAVCLLWPFAACKLIAVFYA